jgi:ribosome-associated heat shock protein Hsp15
MADLTPIRVDKWLWAARLSKTRGVAADAVKSGRVQINGQPVKPSREVRPGDRLELRTGEIRRTFVVRGTAQRRGPAKEAVLLYEETPESVAARERLTEQRRLDVRSRYDDGGPRPTKRDRRRFEQLRTRTSRDE